MSVSQPRDADSVPSDPFPTQFDLSPRTHAYLASLPDHLRPVSPYLAALHDARLRLLTMRTPHAKSPIRWCSNCGSLRDFISEALAVSDIADGLGGSPSKSMRGSPVKTKVVKSKCATCGSVLRRTKKITPDPGVLAGFKPARAVRRSLRATASTSDIRGSADPALPPPVTVVGDVFSGPGTIITDISAPISQAEDHPMDDSAETVVTTTPNTEIPVVQAADEPMLADADLPTPKRQQASPLTAPALRYIPSTSPTPPTYIQPPAVRPTPTPPSAGGTSTTASAKSAGEATRRKKKKSSGLAKLLAQSKEREESAAGGKWGFG